MTEQSTTPQRGQQAQGERTPGTWDWRADYTAGPPIVFGSNKEIICACDAINAEAQANAAFIVRACNAHDELVANLKDVLRILRAVRYTAGIGNKQLERIEMARAALAKATGAQA